MPFYNRGFQNQLLLLIGVLLVLPIILTVYMLHIIHNTELNMVQTHKKKLNNAVAFLDKSFTRTFDEILEERGAIDAPRREKVRLLNQELKPIINQAKEIYPEVELGFYSRSLDVILDGDEKSYGENFSKRRKRAFDETIAGLKPVLQIFGQSEGGQLEVYQPLIRKDQVIGAVWATENLAGIYKRVDEVQRHAYLVIIIGVLIGLGGAFALITSFVSAVTQIKTGVQVLEKDLTRVLPPASGELGEITQAINHLAAKLVNVQNLNEIILASIDDGILAINLQGAIIGLNSAAMRIFNLTEDCLEKNLLDVFPVESPFSTHLLNALNKKVLVKDLEVVYPPASQHALHLLISSNLLVNINQQVVGAVLTCRDITERVHLEEQIRRQERLAALGKLVAGVAHEIRNPLTSISGYTQFWQKNHTPSPRSLAIIHKEVTRLNTIVDKLLHFARPAVAVFGSHDLNALVNRVTQSFKDVHNSDLEIEQNLEEKLPLAWMDPGQIEQVLFNILYNAAQAMSDKGKIKVTSSFDKERRMLVISVTDYGRGIPEEIMPHLFDPFFTTRPKGIGLGLAISYEIMRAHGGDIKIQSQVGKGTTCRIYIPEAKEEKNNGNGTGS